MSEQDKERIQKEAIDLSRKLITTCAQNATHKGYIAGAIAEHERMAQEITHTPAYIVAKEAEKWMMETERLKSELLFRDVTVLPEKDAELDRKDSEIKELKELLKQERNKVIDDVVNDLISNGWSKDDYNGRLLFRTLESLKLHKRKIDICDEVHVLNVNGYIGESTQSEINYAISIGKPISYLNPTTEQDK